MRPNPKNKIDEIPLEDYLFDEEDFIEDFYYDDGDDFELPYESAMEP